MKASENHVCGDDEVFVFGSNVAGVHGKGAARTALEKYGAIYGIGVGAAGRSYAIPTKDKHIQTMSLRDIKPYIDQFLEYARLNHNTKFFVTAVGCGLAGYSMYEMAPMFAAATDNCRLPPEWVNVITLIRNTNIVRIDGNESIDTIVSLGKINNIAIVGNTKTFTVLSCRPSTNDAMNIILHNIRDSKPLCHMFPNFLRKFHNAILVDISNLIDPYTWSVNNIKCNDVGYEYYGYDTDDDITHDQFAVFVADGKIIFSKFLHSRVRTGSIIHKPLPSAASQLSGVEWPSDFGGICIFGVTNSGDLRLIRALPPFVALEYASFDDTVTLSWFVMAYKNFKDNLPNWFVNSKSIKDAW